MSCEFFPFIPEFPIERRIKAQAVSQSLGDGYEYRTSLGLHPIGDTYSMTFSFPNSEVALITNFLEARAFDGIPFGWETPETMRDIEAQPYDELWRCLRWTITPVNQASSTRSIIQMELERQWSHVRDV